MHFFIHTSIVNNNVCIYLLLLEPRINFTKKIDLQVFFQNIRSIIWNTLYNVKLCIYITMYLFGKTGQQNCLAKVGFQNYFSRRGKEQVVNFAKFGSILLKTICQKLCVCSLRKFWSNFNWIISWKLISNLHLLYVD